MSSSRMPSGEIKEVVVRARPNINALDLRARSGVVAQVDMKLLAQKPMIDLSLALQAPYLVSPSSIVASSV